MEKILIIDDDPFILEMYALKFKEEGFSVETAKDGKTGLAKLEEIKPDVVLLDVVMPVMDGFDILKKIKALPNPRPRVFFLTNFGQKDDIERGMKLGADDYIIKAHYTPSEVVAKIRELLEK